MLCRSCSPFQAAGAYFPRLAFKLFSVAAARQGRRHDHEATVDHALMRGLVAAGPVMRRGACSVAHARHFKLQARIFLAWLSSCSAWPQLGKAGGTIMKRRLIML